MLTAECLASVIGRPGGELWWRQATSEICHDPHVSIKPTRLRGSLGMAVLRSVHQSLSSDRCGPGRQWGSSGGTL